MLSSSFWTRKFLKEAIKNRFQMVGEGPTFRNIKFKRGLEHALDKHFFDTSNRHGKYALKYLDPHGNIDKWMQYISKIAQTGTDIRNVQEVVKSGTVIGERRDVWGKMVKTGGEFLKITGDVIAKGVVKKIDGSAKDTDCLR